MKNKFSSPCLSRSTLIGSALTFALCGPAMAAEAAGMVKTLKGSAEIERDGKRLPVSVGTEVFPKDRISTGSQSAVGLTLKDNTQMSAGANALLELNKFSFNATSHAGELDTSVKRGALSVISGKVAKANPDAVRFNTGTVTLGVRGTEFIIEAGDD
jgi:hypothetical protein